MYTVDTNIIVYYLQNDVNAVSFFDDVSKLVIPVFLSGVSETELLSYRLLTREDIRAIEDTIAFCNVVHTNAEITRLAAEIRRKYRVKTVDAIIAATAIFTNSTLVTRNTRDFNKIPGFSLLKI